MGLEPEDKLMNMKMDSQVSVGLLKSFGGDLGYTTDGWGGDRITRVYNTWQPLYSVTTSRDTFSEAFKIVSMMIEKGYLKNITLKKFITIVKETAELL